MHPMSGRAWVHQNHTDDGSHTREGQCYGTIVGNTARG